MKTLIITADKTLEAISEAFQTHFPNLRLQFYTEEHAVGETNSLWDTLNPTLSLAQVGKIDHEETLSIHGGQKVQTFEQNFQQLYKLGVQVMYPIGREWRQTRTSDALTLAQLNQMAENKELIG